MEPISELAMVGSNVASGEQVDFTGSNANGLEGALISNTAQLGLWIFLATVTMLFAGFTSAYLVRQTTGSDWQPIPLPPILWLNTVLLISSSVTMELARSQQRWRENAFKGWLSATTVLGVAPCHVDRGGIEGGEIGHDAAPPPFGHRRRRLRKGVPPDHLRARAAKVHAAHAEFLLVLDSEENDRARQPRLGRSRSPARLRHASWPSTGRWSRATGSRRSTASSS